MFRPLLRSPCFNRRLGSVQLRWASTYHETAPFNPHAKRKATSWLSPYKLLLGFMPIFTFGLGTWQVQRLQWKLGLIKELEEQLDKEPMELPRIINLAALPEFEWRRVTVRGVWDHAHSVLIGPRVRENQGGYNLVTPLKRPSASTILVDRGFVEKELAEAARDNKLPGILGDEPVEITGMLRLQPKRNAFTPENSPGKGVWYWPDIDQLVQYAGGADAGVQPVLVEAIFEGDVGERLTNMKRGVPIGRSTVVDIRNEHATYAVIWYSLSGVTSLMLWLLLRGRKPSQSGRSFRRY